MGGNLYAGVRTLEIVVWTSVFFGILVANIGIPFPITASYLLAAGLIEGGQSYTIGLTVLTAAHVGGSMIAYGIGWWGEDYLTQRFQHRPGFIKASNSIRSWYAHYGSITVFATRFIGYVRPWSSLVDGFARINWQPFLWWTFLGSLLLNIILLEFWVYFMDLWLHFGWLMRGSALIWLAISGTAIYWIHHYWRQYP